MAWAGVAMSVVSAVQSFQQGQEQKRTAKFNLKVADAEARYQESKAKADVKRHWRQVKRTMADQKLAYITSGVAATSGSALQAYTDSMSEAYLDAAIIRSNGDASAAKARWDGQYAYREGMGQAYRSFANAGTSLLSAYSQGKDLAGGQQTAVKVEG